MKTDEVGKVVQILGYVIIPLIARVPLPACGYDAPSKRMPPNTALNPSPANKETFPWQSDLLNPNFSLYPPVCKEL